MGKWVKIENGICQRCDTFWRLVRKLYRASKIPADHLFGQKRLKLIIDIANLTALIGTYSLKEYSGYVSIDPTPATGFKHSFKTMINKDNIPPKVRKIPKSGAGAFVSFDGPVQKPKIDRLQFGHLETAPVKPGDPRLPELTRPTSSTMEKLSKGDRVWLTKRKRKRYVILEVLDNEYYEVAKLGRKPGNPIKVQRNSDWKRCP